MPLNAKVFRIVLISPGDTLEERRVVADLVQRINASQVRWTNRLLWLDRWEDAPPAASSSNPQSTLDEFLRIESADLVIAIFRSRLGGAMEGNSGTLHELTQAQAAFQKRGRPEVFVYFYKPADPDSVCAEVEAFEKQVHKWLLTKPYTSIDEFGGILTFNLLSWQNKVIGDVPSLRSDAASEDPGPLRMIMHSPLGLFYHCGLTERVPAVTIQLEGGGSQMKGGRVDVTLFFNTNLTSRIVGDKAASEATLTDWASGSVYHARQTSMSSIVFEGISITGASSGQTLVADRLRVNGAQLGEGRIVTCWGSILPSPGYRFTTVIANPTVVIGRTQPKVSVAFQDLICLNSDGLYWMYSLECHVAELVAGTFVATEDGCTSGTRFLFQFVADVDGVMIDVEPSAKRSSDGLVVSQQIMTDVNGASGPEPSYPLTFEWVVAPNASNVLQTVIFRFTIGSPSQLKSGLLRGAVHLAPLFTVGTASDAAPIPRFVPSGSVELKLSDDKP